MYFDCGTPDQSCEISVILGSQPGSSFCSPVKCVTLFEEEYCVVINCFKEVKWIPENVLCELYVVKILEGMV